jgi:two-component system, cell cycle response regulator
VEPTAPPTLLCIDDDAEQHQSVAAMVAAFRRSRYAVEFASTYDDGLARLVDGGYAACLLDDRLGGRDGLELLREAHATNPATPIIVMTSAGADDADLAASEAGAIDSLVKSEMNARVLERSVHYAVKLGSTLALLRGQALTDGLTGLLNRRELQNLLQNEWLRAVRFKRAFALGLADIDHFKSVNDTYGHPIGDRVIKHVGEVMQTTLRRLDRVARFGGDEFAILMPETGRREAAIAMERVRAALAKSPCIVAEQGLRIAVTLSIGVAVPLEDADSADALIEVADRRLYAAKHGGRDRLCTDD